MFPDFRNARKSFFFYHQGTMMALAPFHLRKQKEMERLTQRIKVWMYISWVQCSLYDGSARAKWVRKSLKFEVKSARGEEGLAGKEAGPQARQTLLGLWFCLWLLCFWPWIPDSIPNIPSCEQNLSCHFIIPGILSHLHIPVISPISTRHTHQNVSILKEIEKTLDSRKWISSGTEVP